MGTEACPWCKAEWVEGERCGRCGHPEFSEPPQPAEGLPKGHGPRASPSGRLDQRFVDGQDRGTDPLGRLQQVWDRHLNQSALIRTLPPGLVASAEARRRFQRAAAQRVGRGSPGRAPLLGFCPPDALVHGRAPGPRLGRLLQARKDRGQGGYGLDAIVRLMEPVVRALEPPGPPHGLVSVYTLVLGPVGLWLSDDAWAFALTPEARRRWARAGGLAHLARLPPEWAEEGAEPSRAWDVYGLAAVAWEMATLEPPFGPRSPGWKLQHRGLAVLCPGLRLDPSLRPSTPRAWFQDVQAAAERSAPRPPGPGRGPKPGGMATFGPVPSSPALRETVRSDLGPSAPPGEPGLREDTEAPALGCRDGWRASWATLGGLFFFVTGLLAWVAPG